MFKSFDFCLPTKSPIVPHGLDWFHELNYDDNTLRLERDGRCSHDP
jgi:bifunctional non-homologous end joining protein LigD